MQAVTHSLTAYPCFNFNNLQGLYKNKLTRSPQVEKQKGVKKKKKKKSNAFPPHGNTNVRQAPTALSPTLKQICTHTLSYKHTLTYTNTQVRLQSLAEREGDASKGSVWTVAATKPPHPTRLSLP